MQQVGFGFNVASNNSSKPTPLRCGPAVARKACHRMSSTTQRGLTRALDGGKKHSGSVASTSDAIAPGASRRFCSDIPSDSVRRAACRTLSSAASELSPVIGFPTVPLVRRLRFGHNDLVHRPLWCSRLAAGDSRITVAATACSRPASALTSRLTIRPSRRRFAARLNSGVRRGKKHSGSVASTSDASAPGTSRRFCSEIPSGSARRAACRTLSSAASALSPVIRFPTVPLVRRLRFGHNGLIHGPCGVRGLRPVIHASRLSRQLAAGRLRL